MTALASQVFVRQTALPFVLSSEAHAVVKLIPSEIARTSRTSLLAGLNTAAPAWKDKTG